MIKVKICRYQKIIWWKYLQQIQTWLYPYMGVTASINLGNSYLIRIILVWIKAKMSNFRLKWLKFVAAMILRIETQGFRYIELPYNAELE